MERLFEYLCSKKKMEIFLGIIFYIYLPTYLINFTYYPEWFNTTEFIKIAILNAAIQMFLYVMQMFIFIAINFGLTKKGRTTNEMYYIPLIVLGFNTYLTVLARIATVNLLHVTIIMTTIVSILEESILFFALENKEPDKEIKDIFVEDCD